MTTTHPNPYAVITTELAADQQTTNAEPLLLVNNRTNVGGRLWSPCMQAVYSDRLELKFLFQTFTLPVEKIRLLRSGGKRFGRHLEIIHDENSVPEKIHFIPLYPAKWYSVFESLGIQTEDETSLRESKQIHHRMSEWCSNAESLFWMLWIGLIITVPLVVGLINLIGKLI